MKMDMNIYRQAKSGTWHIVYMERTNCNRFNPTNWKNDKLLKRNELPETAKICKKCFINNQ